MEVKVHIEKVTEDLSVLRVDDARVRFFEGTWEIPEGVSYNAYLLTTGEGAVLFDGWKREYGELLVDSLGRLVDLRDISLVVVHHSEPDHSGSAPLVAERAPRAVFLGHPIAGRVLKSHYGVERFKPVRDGEALRAGDRTLRFIHAPWLHWPDTIFTFIEEEGVLLTCDAFGSYSLPPLFDDQADPRELERFTRKYAVTIVGHYSGWILKGIEKLKSLGVSPKVIAPGHGTIYRSRPEWIVERWAEIASGRAKPGKVTIAYVSMYGNVDRAIERLRELLVARGFEVVVHAFTDKSRALVSEVLADASDAEALVLGTPVYEAEPHPLMLYVARLIGEKLPSRKAMPVVVVSSYGWGPAGKRLLGVLEGYGFTNLHLIEFEGAHTADALEKIVSALERARS